MYAGIMKIPAQVSDQGGLHFDLSVEARLTSSRAPRASLAADGAHDAQVAHIGGEDDSEDAARRGEQRVWAGDLVVHS